MPNGFTLWVWCGASTAFIFHFFLGLERLVDGLEGLELRAAGNLTSCRLLVNAFGKVQGWLTNRSLLKSYHPFERQKSHHMTHDRT